MMKRAVVVSCVIAATAAICVGARLRADEGTDWGLWVQQQLAAHSEELDPIARRQGDVRACWTDTERMSNGGGSAVETGAIYGEVMCLVDVPDGSLPGGAIPTVSRFIAGDPQANYFDNLAFQPHTGNLVVLEDGEVEVVKPDGTTELRGNDIWMCLPDGGDRDVQSDGCIRILSLTDTTSEPTGFIFTGSGQTAYVNLQHRSAGQGALLRITGFKVRDHHGDPDNREGRKNP